MLVLTRKINESIIINEDIELQVLSIDGDQVKLGIQAPRSVDIHRKEVFLSIQNENESAANPNDATEFLKQLKKIKKS